MIRFIQIIGLILAVLIFPAMAESPLLQARIVGKESFPVNSGPDIWHFDGCADCSGPWAVTASDSLGPLDEASYEPGQLDDNNLATCWAAPRRGSPWIAFASFAPGRGEHIPIHGFSMVNGYTKNPDRWAQNARVKILLVTVGDREVARVQLLDTPAVQSIRFPEDIFLKGKEALRLTVLSTYSGSYFNDICISEFQLNAGH
jgi:hypothetical protein